MTEPVRILRPEDVSEIESFADEDIRDYDAILECLGRVMSEGITDGRFTEKQVQNDLDFALWVAFACNNIDDYEHYCTSIEWLSRVEGSASGCGPWFYRYAVALMYAGKPRKALEYLSRGVEEQPAYPWTWHQLARLRAHFGDRDGAMSAANKGMELVPGNPDFEELLRDIQEGRTLEEMEFRFNGDVDPARGTDPTECFFHSDDPDVVSRATAVMGIDVDTGRLNEIKTALRPSGWIPDHPYCTFMTDGPKGQVLVSLAMNEAFLSKIPVQRIESVIRSLPDLESQARSGVTNIGPQMPLYAITVARDLSVMLSFGDSDSGEPVNAMFSDKLELLRTEVRGGPFVAFVLLTGDSWDSEAVKKALSEDWGIGCREKAEEGNLVFEHRGDLAAYSLFASKVPDGEAEENAANNYRWPEAVDVTSTHTAHLMVALVNHGATPVDAALVHTKMVAAACRLPNAIGVYYQGTVVSTEDFLKDADRIRSDELPIDDWIWFGIAHTEEGYHVYTRGLSTFGKDEMEVTDPSVSAEDLREFLYEICHYILSNDAVLSDGDEIGFEEGKTFTIVRSPGIALDGMTLKITYPH